MIVTSSPRSASVNPLSMIDRLLAQITLTPTQYDDAKRSYEAVGAVLAKQNSPICKYWPEIFPQGSMRLGTTIRPYGQERFDLDMICRLSISCKATTPDGLFKRVWDALGTDETYRQMRRAKSRCIRLEYAKERNFYLDVTPAVPDWDTRKESIYIPDRERKEWCSTHPVAYSDRWFKVAAEKHPIITRVAIANDRRFEIRAGTIEAMPEYGEFEKTPLQRIVQLLKYHRDRYFEHDQEHRPSSILLTTLITHSYSREVNESAESMLDFVVRVVNGIPRFIEVTVDGNARYFKVSNPVNLSENFAEKWQTQHYVRFNEWHNALVELLQSLKASRGQGADVMLKRLSVAFGNEPVTKVANALGVDTQRLHDAGKLRVSAAVGVGAAGTSIPKTIFYCDGH